MYAVEIKNLGKTYRGNASPALNDLSLNIEKGEIFGLLGPNGAGKTTLIHILCGLQNFDHGHVAILNHILPRELSSVKPLTGVVPQDIALYPTLSVMENLKVVGGIFGMKRSQILTRAEELLNTFGLSEHRNKRIEICSGGMKRRVNLIAGLMHRPQLVFLDEPTVGIDVQSKRLIIDSLREINRDGCTIIYTSHYMEEAETLCSRTGIIDEGRMICSGPPAELVKSHGAASLEDLYLRITGKNLRE
jgi:ABC-2 type transport system ATP-binding protein